MPNLKASQKDVRRISKRRLQNRQKISRLRTLRKKLYLLAAENKLEEARQEFRQFSRYLDRAGRRHLLHPRRAARYKSRMALFLDRVAKKSEKVA